ncbi:MAG: PAS domain-containing sensor histidine kinase [Longimicrobiaceae bacterium]
MGERVTPGRLTEDRYRLLVEGSKGVFVYLHTPDHRFEYLSPSVKDVLGYEAGELIGQPYDVLLADDPGMAAEVHRLTEETLSSPDRPVIYTALCKHRDGRAVALELVETSVVVDGDAVGVHGFARDVSDRLESEKELRLQKVHWEYLFTISPEPIALLDNHDRVVRVNQAFTRLFGFQDSEVAGRPINQLIVPAERREEASQATRRVTTGETVSFETVRQRKDGTPLRVHVLGTPIKLEGGQVGIYGIYRDVTGEREREERLRRAERLASLGTLLSGVAHELNNPLTSVRSFAQLLLQDERPREDREALEIVQREAGRAARIVADLKLFAGESVSREEPVNIDLNEVVWYVLKVRESHLEAREVAVERDLAEPLPAVRARRRELEQLLLNLVVNAEHALAEKRGERRLTVRTRSRHGRVRLEVADTGAGIESPNLERVFDPFWTTKEPGAGIGLGLSLAHRMVTGMGGEIRVKSEQGSGAAFTVELPAAGRAEEG